MSDFPCRSSGLQYGIRCWTRDGGAAPTDFIQYVQPPPGVDSCGSNCYSAADYLRDKIASPGQASESEWDNINQSVGNLADKILAQLC